MRNDPKPLDVGPAFAPDRPDMPTDMRLKLDLRIHRQRLALRENWQIVESRQRMRGVHPDDRLLRSAMRLLRENRSLREQLESLRSGENPEPDATDPHPPIG